MTDKPNFFYNFALHKKASGENLPLSKVKKEHSILKPK